MGIEYRINDDGSRTVTSISLTNVKEWRNLMVVPVLPVALFGAGLLIMAAVCFSGLSLGEHIHALNATRLLALPLIPMGLVLGLILPTAFMLISALGIALLIWSWKISDDWHDAAHMGHESQAS